MPRRSAARKQRRRRWISDSGRYPKSAITAHAYDRYRERYGMFLAFEECIRLRNVAQGAPKICRYRDGRTLHAVFFRDRCVPVILSSDGNVIVTILPSEALDAYLALEELAST